MAPEEQEELLEVVRGQNRALRSINRSLRKRVVRMEEHGDRIFLALCGSNTIEEGLVDQTPATSHQV